MNNLASSSNSEQAVLSVPWFKEHVSEWYFSTRNLSLEARGAYHELRVGQWHRGGPLPKDDNELARIVGCPVDRWLELSTAVLPLFKSNEQNIWSVDIIRQLEELRELRAKRQRAGLRSAEERKKVSKKENTKEREEKRSVLNCVQHELNTRSTRVEPEQPAPSKRGSQFPEGFQPNDAHHALAVELGVNLDSCLREVLRPPHQQGVNVQGLESGAEYLAS